MGAVYLAEHPTIGKKVALKVIHRELASNREVVQRFFQEAQAVNKIGSEHIVEIHDFGVTPEGDHYYIMEYLEGSNLGAVLGREAVLDTRRALHIGAQIASALAAAHAAGVIHRDLKPDNVMLTLRLGDVDFVKLLDFGLAKMFAGGPSSVKTAAGVLLGTPQYMSPEACESRVAIDHRTDIYALGILLFQMMTGVLPFDGESMGEVLVKQVTQLPPPPRGYNPNIPPSVEQILLRCLMKQPDARFPTMNSLREALLDPERYLHQSPPMSPARSLAPGELRVDAKAVSAYAAQHQRNNAAQQAQQATRIGLSKQLPLVSPPSMSGHGGNASNATMIGDGSMIPPRPIPGQGPDLAFPALLKTNTMRIATPLGYSSRQPRKVLPIVVVVALGLGLGGGIFAVSWYRRSQPDPATATVQPAGEPKRPSVVTADAALGVALPAPDSAPVATIFAPAATMAAVELDSVPSGAEVFGAGQQLLGVTPIKLRLPIRSEPVQIELRLAGFKPKLKQLVVSGNEMIQVSLDRALAANPTGTPNHGAPKKHPKQCDTCLERPD
ncbi:hypothetical protein BH11MYX1_BH11MYX1_37160 [soil metagenome]